MDHFVANKQGVVSKNKNKPLIGILMLDTVFKRIPGDIGNPNTFNFPVQYKIVKSFLLCKLFCFLVTNKALSRGNYHSSI